MPKIASIDKVVEAYNQLAHAEAEIEELSELLPICASCKSVRDDSGYWSSVETYMKERTGSEFSHSICPDCVKRLYPSISKTLKAKRDATPDGQRNKNI